MKGKVTAVRKRFYDKSRQAILCQLLKALKISK
jgi:hypothetical protein